MKISFFTRWFYQHLEKQPEFVKKLLQNSAITKVDEKSMARAVAIGLFMCCMPLPFHSVLAALIAIFFQANPLISFTILWIVNNTFSMVPLFYFCYRVGLWILHLPAQDFMFEESWQWVVHELGLIWQPFLLGCFVSGLVLAVSGYIITRVVYRIRQK